MRFRRSAHYGIVASRFNRQITESLVKGALKRLKAHGIPSKKIDVTWVPGAFELPLAALRMAKSGRYRAIVAVGCILAGETPQYTYLANTTFQGLGLAGVLSGVPITCGVIVAREFKHALQRAKANGLNRGREAAEAAWELSHFYAR